MKKAITLFFSIVFCIALLSGCGEEKKIEELETKIAEIKSKNASKEIMIDSWQSSLDSARELYNQPHSSSAAVQSELSKMKSNMDELSQQIAQYEADIARNNVFIEGYQEQIDRLKDK